VAIGTDTGGSVRLPAAWCGTVGLKVTAGRISTYGVLPLSFTLDTPGPLARSSRTRASSSAHQRPRPRDPRPLPGLHWIGCPCSGSASPVLRLGVMPDAERGAWTRKCWRLRRSHPDAREARGPDRSPRTAPSLQRLCRGHRAHHRRGRISLRGHLV
jgi:Asp-tRNA(Asn)/Glu-tRNA(Gln) amidotransferase A subunit family amidase